MRFPDSRGSSNRFFSGVVIAASVEKYISHLFRHSLVLAATQL
jgi:hypothetical protein